MKPKIRLAVSCVTGFALLLCTATLAHAPSAEHMKQMMENPWAVELGDHRDFGFPTKEACEEAAIRTLPPGHCVYMDWSTGRILGTQDPEWIALNERRGGWSVEFIGSMGKWSRIGGFQSEEACAAVIRTLPKSQGGDGHCVLGEWKDGRVRFIGSQDPAWAGK